MGALASVVAAGRAAIEATLMPDACEIQTGTDTTDGAGGVTTAWATTATVACQVSGVTARNATVADRLAEVVDKEITLPAGTAVAATQRIVHVGGATYKIVGVDDRPSIELARTVFAQIVRP